MQPPNTVISHRFDPHFDRVEALLESMITRVALSLIILFSVLPEAVHRALLPSAVVEHLNTVFLLIFGPELLLRLLLFVRRAQRRRLMGYELALLALDLLAVISFLPLPFAETSGLRFLRLARMLLLLGYWGGLVRELWAILSRRERRYQILLVLALGLVLALTSTILLMELAPAYDFDGDGQLDVHDGNFTQVLWWSFRQVQDPGNLVQQLDNAMVVLISIGLTFAGLLLFSFFIGIGNSVVQELVYRSRGQQVGYSDHTVVLGMTPESRLLFFGLAEIYRKNLRPYRAAVLAPEATEPACFNDPRLGFFRFRYGDPVDSLDLDRVNIERAKRVIVLGPRTEDPDAEVIATTLATRERNPGVDLYTDLEHERNFRAVRTAGGPKTHLMGSGPLFGYYLAQNIAHPGVYNLLRQLLESTGCEIYTYMYTAEERRRLVARQGAEGLHLPTFHSRAHRRFHVNLLGFFTSDREGDLAEDELDLLINPLAAMRQGRHPALNGEGRLPWNQVRGLIGITSTFRSITRVAQELLKSPFTEEAGTARRDAAATPTARREAPTTSTGPLRLVATRRPVERILICGASPRVPRVVTELVAFFHRLEVTVLARQNEHFDSIPQDLRKMLSEVWQADSTLEKDAENDGILRLECEADQCQARVSFAKADWTHSHYLREHDLVAVDDADAILLLPVFHGAADTDGTIALDCLHLANLERGGTVHFQEHLHILAMVRDPVKGKLLETRLVQMNRAEGGSTRYTVISRERARHLFIMQCVFVRGLNSIYLSLLRFKGQFLSRLEATTPEGHRPPGSFDPWDLAQDLLTQRGLVFLGYERLDERGDSEAIIDPHALQAGESIPWSTVEALYVLGDEADVAAAAACR